MLAEVGRAEEGHGAELAGEGLRVRVGVHVCLQVTALGERLVAHAALMRPNIKKFRCRNSSITTSSFILTLKLKSWVRLKTLI